MADDLTVARPYARAAFSYADENNALDSWLGYLTALAALVKYSDITEKAEVGAAEDTVKYASDILKEFMDEKQANFFRLLLEVLFKPFVYLHRISSIIFKRGG